MTWHDSARNPALDSSVDTAQFDYLTQVLGLDRVLVPPLPALEIEEKSVEIHGTLGGARLLALVPLTATEFPLRGEAAALLERMLQAMKLHKHEVLIASWVAFGITGEDFAVEDEIARLVHAAGGRSALVFGGAAAAARLIESRQLGEWGVWSGARILATFPLRELLQSPEQKRMAWVHLQTVMKHL
jgi:hypothetical protein